MSEQIQFEIGDRVWLLIRQQWGNVVQLDAAAEYSVRVEFASGETRWFRNEELVFEEIVIPPSARTRPNPTYGFKPNETLDQFFSRMRCDEAHHLGLGDIRLTFGQQEELVNRFGDPNPRPDLKIDNRVIVRSTFPITWVRGYFTE